MSACERYDVNIVFRGLFLAEPTEYGLAILLPDGRNPQGLMPRKPVPGPEQLANEPALAEAGTAPEDAALATVNEERRQLHGRVGPYQEHFGLLEFDPKDWKNPENSTSSTIRLKKPDGAEVMWTLLGEPYLDERAADWIRFSSSGGDGFELPEERHHIEPFRRFDQLDRFRILDPTEPRSHAQLPPYRAGVRTQAWKKSVAFTLITSGEVTTERHSRLGDRDLFWFFVPAPLVNDEGTVPPGSIARPINLDLRVGFTLPSHEALVVELVPRLLRINGMHALNFLPPLDTLEGAKQFVLKPADPAKGLHVVINNRELNLALLGQDLDLEKAPCGRQISVDRDHGLFMELAKFPALVTIPHLRPRGVSNCGGACGGCGGGGA